MLKRFSLIVAGVLLLALAGWWWLRPGSPPVIVDEGGVVATPGLPALLQVDAGDAAQLGIRAVAAEPATEVPLGLIPAIIQTPALPLPCFSPTSSPGHWWWRATMCRRASPWPPSPAPRCWRLAPTLPAREQGLGLPAPPPSGCRPVLPPPENCGFEIVAVAEQVSGRLRRLTLSLSADGDQLGLLLEAAGKARRQAPLS